MGFYLIQRGKFNNLKAEYNGLTGNEGLIDLDYMGYSEFEWGALPKAYRRLLWNREDYVFHYCNDIKDINGKILVIYCNKNSAEQIEHEMKEYISKPYGLKSFCSIEDHMKGYGDVNPNDFYWCIDKKDTGDWMGWFGMDKVTPFKRTLDKDYNEWWMNKSDSKRLEEYKKSI